MELLPLPVLVCNCPCHYHFHPSIPPNILASSQKSNKSPYNMTAS